MNDLITKNNKNDNSEINLMQKNFQKIEILIFS